MPPTTVDAKGYDPAALQPNELMSTVLAMFTPGTPG